MSDSIIKHQKNIRQFAEERDWKQFHSPKNLSMAIATETAELQEHFLWEDSPESWKTLNDPDKKTAISDELADIMIYCLRFADVCDIDVSEAITRKMGINNNKYPVETSKGNSKKYTDL